MTKPVAIVTRKWPEENEKRLKELFDVTLNKDDKIYKPQEIIDGSKNFDGILTVSYTHLTLPTKA